MSQLTGRDRPRRISLQWVAFVLTLLVHGVAHADDGKPAGIRLVWVDPFPGPGIGPAVGARTLIPWGASKDQMNELLDAQPGGGMPTCTKTDRAGEEYCYFLHTPKFKGWFADFGNDKKAFVFDVTTRFFDDEFFGYEVDYPLSEGTMVKSTLENALGKPSKSSVSKLQNAFGASFDQATFIWSTKNVDVSLMLRNPADLEKGLLEVKYKPIAKRVPTQAAAGKAPF